MPVGSDLFALLPATKLHHESHQYLAPPLFMHSKTYALTFLRINSGDALALTLVDEGLMPNRLRLCVSRHAVLNPSCWQMKPAFTMPMLGIAIYSSIASVQPSGSS